MRLIKGIFAQQCNKIYLLRFIGMSTATVTVLIRCCVEYNASLQIAIELQKEPPVLSKDSVLC